MPFGSRRILSTVGTAIPATSRWWFAAWRCGLCRICLGENLPAPLIELCLGPSWVSPGWFLSESCLGWRTAWFPTSCCMMTGPLSLAVSPDTLSSIPLGSAQSPRLWSSLIRSGWIISVEVWMSTFSASGGMRSGPAALPGFKDLMALLTSALAGGLVFTSGWFGAGGMSGGTWGGGLLRISWKCSAHLAFSLASSAMVLSFLSFTGLEGTLFFPDSVLVISYSLFKSLLPAAVSAS